MGVRTHFRLIQLFVLVFSLALAFPAAYGQRKPILIGYSSLSSNQAAIWVAKEQGFFKKFGLEAELIFIEGGTRGAQTLISGDLPLLTMGGQPVLNARARGADLVLIAGLVNQMNYILVSAPGVKKPEDLRSKRIAISQIGTSSHHAAILTLKHWGLDVRRDRITILQVGNQAARVSSLQSGGSDVVIVNPGLGPTLKARGFNVLADFTELPISYPLIALATRERFLKSEPDMAERILMSIVAANAFILDPENKEKVKAVLAKYLRLDGPEKAEEQYQAGLKVFVRKPYVELAGIASMIELMAESDPSVAKLKPETIVNHSLLKRLDEAGFIDELSRR